MARRARPLPTVVLLVRHGQTLTTGKELPGRAPGLHLSELGKAQVEATAEWLAASPRIDAVYSSPLERAQETAALIASRLGLDVRVEQGLIEGDYGEWTGAEIKALAKTPEWQAVQRYPSGFHFPGGESFRAMLTRVTTALAELCATHPGGVIVAVSHADPIRVAVADALGLHLDLFQRIVVAPASVSAVAYGELGPTVLTVNSARDLNHVVPQRPARAKTTTKST
jgi:probable phosphomutase (TIGR03848 family)